MTSRNNRMQSVTLLFCGNTLGFLIFLIAVVITSSPAVMSAEYDKVSEICKVIDDSEPDDHSDFDDNSDSGDNSGDVLLLNLLALSGDLTVDSSEIIIIKNGNTEEVSNVFLGSAGHGTIIVAGAGSTLNVTGPASTAPGFGGTGFLFATGSGTINMQGEGQIAFNGDALFDNSYLFQKSGTLLNVGNGRIDFNNGTTVNSAGTMIAAGGVFVNDHSVLNVDGADGILHIDGDLEFSHDSTLGIMIGKNNSGLIDAGGHNVILDGNLVVTPEYGYATAPIAQQPFIDNCNDISGTFANVRLSNSRFGTLEVAYDTDHATLTFNPSTTPYSNFTQTANEHSVGRAIDTIHQDQLANFAPLMQTMWNMSDTELQALYNVLSGEIRAETMAMPLASPGRMAFDRVGWDSAAGHVFFGPQYRLAARGSNRATWFRPYYIGDKVKSDGNASRYTMDGYGFIGGFDQTLRGGKTAVGVMLGYGRPELDSRNDKAKLDDFLIGAYIASRFFDAWEIKAWGGYGYQYYDMQRHVNLMGTPQTFKSNFKGHTTTFSGELARPVYTMSRLVLKPTVGYDGLFLTQNAGDETGDPLVSLKYHKTSIERHIGRIGVNAEYGDSARSLYGGAHYKYLLGGDQVYYSQASFTGGGPAFVVEGVDLGKAFVSANIGLQINLSDDRSRLLFVDYTADFGDNSAYFQMATVGLQQTF